MKQWWCEEHKTQAFLSQQPRRGCWKAELGLQAGVAQTVCRMVEMQLVPADARMVSAEPHRLWMCANTHGEPVTVFRDEPRDSERERCTPECGWKLIFAEAAVSVSDPTKAAT